MMALKEGDGWSLIASLNWVKALAKGRPDDIGRSAEIARSGDEKRFKLVAVAVSPGPWIETREHTSEYAVYNASSLSVPAWMNRFRVPSLARKTRRSSAVMR